MCLTFFFLLRDLFFTCFASFYYLVIHSILFHYIHAFIWIYCAPLIILDHLYVSRVKLSSFLYPLSIMTKMGRNCGGYMVSIFLRFYMLGGEIHSFVRGRCVSSCLGSAYFLVLIRRSCDHVYIHYAYLWWCMSSSPTFTCVVSFLSLCTCFLYFVCNLLFLFHTKIPW